MRLLQVFYRQRGIVIGHRQRRMPHLTLDIKKDSEHSRVHFLHYQAFLARLTQKTARLLPAVQAQCAWVTFAAH